MLIIWLMRRQKYRRLVLCSRIKRNLRAGWRKSAKETEDRNDVSTAARVPATVARLPSLGLKFFYLYHPKLNFWA